MKFNSNIINCAIVNNFKLNYDALVGQEIKTATGVSLNDKIKNVIVLALNKGKYCFVRL